MPQITRPHPLFVPLTQQAVKAVALLHRHIAQREQELTELKAEAARWQRLVDGYGPGTRLSAASQVRATPRARLDWSTVLQALPAKFTLSDVARIAQRPMQHVYVSIGRWAKNQKIRKVADGYQKLAAAPRARTSQHQGR